MTEIDNDSDEVMVEGAKNALKVVLSMGSGEPILIVTDKHKQDIASAFERGAEALGAKVRTCLLPEEQRPLSEVPQEISKELEHCKSGGVIINAFEANSTETPFRIKLIKEELGTNSRIGHAPGITMSMMRDGPMTVDWFEIAQKVDILIGKFVNASTEIFERYGFGPVTEHTAAKVCNTDECLSVSLLGQPFQISQVWRVLFLQPVHQVRKLAGITGLGIDLVYRAVLLDYL